MIRFSDGLEFDTRGPFRVVEEFDGFYVVGNGLLCPVKDREEGEAYIATLKARFPEASNNRNPREGGEEK